MADSIPCYDSLVGCLNLELRLKFYTRVRDCPMVVWGRMCDLSMACLYLGFGQDLDGLRARSRIILCPVVACLCSM